MQVGAQLYTVRDFIQTPPDISASLKKVAAIGYRYVQCSKLGPIDPHHLRDLLDENGLTCLVTHVDPERMLQNIAGVIEEHRIIGCPDIGMSIMPKRYWGSAAGVRALIADYRPVVQQILDAGMHFHYHNHDLEYIREEGRALLDILLEEWPEAHLLLCAFWTQAGGADPVQCLQTYGDRIKHVHLKDMSCGLRNGERVRLMQPVLEGNMDYRRLIDLCKEKGVEGLLVEQDDCNGLDPFECLKISFENLRGLGLC